MAWQVYMRWPRCGGSWSEAAVAAARVLAESPTPACFVHASLSGWGRVLYLAYGGLMVISCPLLNPRPRAY